MIFLAIGLLCLTAVFGLYMFFSYVRKHQAPPKPIALLHGLSAFFGFISLVAAAFTLGIPYLWLAVGMFVLVACGGLYLFTQDIVSHHLRAKMVLGHGIFALCSIAVVIYAVFRYFQ